MVQLRRGILETVRTDLPGYKSAERRVAQAILDDPEDVVRSNVKVLSARAEVSEPTVIRFVRKLGSAGFSEFKISLAQEMAIDRVFAQTERFETDDTAHRLIERVSHAVTRSISEIAASLSEAQIGQVARQIAGAHRLYCLGVGGGSAIVALEAENRFFRAGIAVQASADPYRQLMNAAIAGPGDVFLIFSSTGQPESLVNAAELARSRGASVVSVTRADSPLAMRSDHVLRIGAASGPLHQYYIPNPVRYEQMLIIDCLAARMTVDMGEAAISKLRSIRGAIASLHGVLTDQPLGD